MTRFDLIVTCHFGLEAVVKREITDLGYDVASVEDGRVTVHGDAEALVRLSICSRTAGRVLVKLGSFAATDYDALYEGTKALALEQWIPRDGRFWVAKASCVKSALYSPSDIQRVMKRAMVDRLSGIYGISQFPESGASYPMRVFLKKDEVTVGLDASGDSLHKRGYRRLNVQAPIAENLAAALLMLTPWHADRILVDPFCGSGTFPIEAAMMAAHIAPGVNRSFMAEAWQQVPVRLWQDTREEARASVRTDVETDIQGYDIDPEAVQIARQHARWAGVEGMIHFQQRDVAQLSHPKHYGFIVTNPPYGERLADREALPALYRTLGERYRALTDWSMYLISSYEGAECDIGRKADRNRKVYNGMIKAYYYQYMGPKPPKRPRVAQGVEAAADAEA